MSKKTVLLLLVSLVLLSIVLRYPLVEYERYQTDSYSMHYLAESIVDNDRALWTFHPLSYIGYYPLSYPSGTPFIIAEISDLTGVSIQVSILFMDFGLATMFCLGAFILSRQFLLKDEYCVLATFFAITGARFVDTTYWNGSARGLLVVLVVLFVITAFRSATMKQKSMYLVGLLLGVGCLASHHMAVLIALLGLAYVLASFQATYLAPRLHLRKRLAVSSFNIAAAVGIAVGTYPFFAYFGNLASELKETSLVSLEPAVLSILVNMGLSYTNQIGFVLIFAFIGMVYLLRRSPLSANSLFLMTLFIVFIPMYGNPLYVSMLLSPFAAVIGVLGLSYLRRHTKRGKLFSTLIVLMIASSIFVTAWSTDRWNSHEYVGGYTVEVDERLFIDANYVRVHYDGVYAVSNAYFVSAVLSASTDSRFLSSSFPMVINGDLTDEDIARNVTWSSKSFPTNLYSWFHYEGEPYVDGYVHSLIAYGVGYILGQGYNLPVGDYYRSHSHLIVAVDNDYASQYVGLYFVQISRLTPQLENATWSLTMYSSNQILESYSIYKSEKLTLYMIQIPFEQGD